MRFTCVINICLYGMKFVVLDGGDEKAKQKSHFKKFRRLKRKRMKSKENRRKSVMILLALKRPM